MIPKLLLAAALLAPIAAHAADITWISSTASLPWQQMPAPALVPADPASPPQIRVAPTKTYQTIDGFGGCFNELGWIALNKATQADREQAIAALFSEDGCAFTHARIPIGSSDFTTDAYSLDDTPGDLELKNFTLARDEKKLLPYIRAAMAVRPFLQCWLSPWSPPAWMKTNGNYSKGSLKWEPAILSSYATYLARSVEEFRNKGVHIYALHPQNEPNILSPYPSCEWTGPQLREFIGDYLGPTLRDRKTNVELWLGTLNGDLFNNGDNANERLVTVMEDPKASAFITGIAFQYDKRNITGTASQLYPDKKLMQSETECNSGANSWKDAQKLYGLMTRYLENNAGSYFAWNMVLDETGIGPWKWRQNSLITVDKTSGKITYNGEYYVMRHFSRYVKPGAKRVLTSGPWGDRIAFTNPDGSTVIVVQNSSEKPQPLSLTIAGRPTTDTLKVTVPPASFNTFVVPPNS